MNFAKPAASLCGKQSMLCERLTAPVTTLDTASSCNVPYQRWLLLECMQPTHMAAAIFLQKSAALRVKVLMRNESSVEKLVGAGVVPHLLALLEPSSELGAVISQLKGCSLLTPEVWVLFDCIKSMAGCHQANALTWHALRLCVLCQMRRGAGGSPRCGHRAGSL